MTTVRDLHNGSSSPRLRGRAQIVALIVLAIAALASTAVAPAHATPIGPCDGACPTPPPPPPHDDSRICESCHPPAPPKVVTVYRDTYAYSTPYFTARSRRAIRATTYVATCEAKGQVGRYDNPWWSRLQNGFWVNNGDLRGAEKMGLGDCAAPANDAPPPRGGRQGCDDCGPVPPYRAGQNLNFYASKHACTSAFVLQLPGMVVGLTAGHCSWFPLDFAVNGPKNEVPVRVTGGDRWPKEHLGPIVANSDLIRNGPDALVFDLGAEVPGAIQEIDTGTGKPLIVDGTVSTKDQRNGVRVCFAGRNSDRCGKIVTSIKKGSRRLICFHARSLGGDSGGPVYLQPRNGHTRAVGILIRGWIGVWPPREETCYAPIDTILRRFNATFPTGAVTPGRGTPA